MKRRPVFLGFVLALAGAVVVPPAIAADNFSVAEQALFVDNHLGGVRPPKTLHYGFRKAGTLERGFDDSVSLALRKQADGSCCSAIAQFLQGERRLTLPEVEAAQANPVILYFLERDVREMNRLTKGQSAYFRKRIRMAAYQSATVEDTTVKFDGKMVPARQIKLSPYLDDPLRERFDKLASKQYVFTLSPAVPGGVVSIVAQVSGESADAPLLAEALWLEGVSPPLSGRNP
jgi:hypothetical protein